MHYILSAAPLLAALCGLSLLSLHSYLLFHSLAEGFSIVIACGIFMTAWNARRLLQNHYLLFIGIAYVYVGGIDFLHTLAYKGMGVFEGQGANLPTQLWLAGRYLEALSLFLATFFLHRKFSAPLVFNAYGLSVALLLASIFYWKVFPVCFVAGAGLTPFKIYSEYAICLLLMAAIGPLIKNAKDFDRKVLILLIASIATTMAQELAFTAYLSVYGSSNMIGHLLKIVSYYLLYKAIIETSLIAPWDLLFRDLKQSEERLRLFIEHTPAAVAIFDRDMRYLAASRRFLRDYRISLPNVIGKNHYEVFPELPERWKRIHRRCLAGAVEKSEEDSFPREDGTLEWLRWEIRPWRTVGGEIGGIILFSEVITAQKRAEEALQKAKAELEAHVRERTAELERRNQELQNFTFVAAHDLQEPLRKLQTFGDLVATRYKGLIDEQGRDYLRRMVGTSARMQTLLLSLLDYSRLTTKPQPFSRIDLKSVLAAVLSDLEVQIAEAQATVEIGDLPEIEGDAVQMASLFQNLLANALKFRREEEPPRVRIRCLEGNGSQTGEWEILVEDNGIGFADEHAGHIFKPFQRLHGKEKYGGVGIGLAICRKVVERHGGSIAVRSTPGQGTTFIVRLPKIQAGHPGSPDNSKSLAERAEGTE